MTAHLNIINKTNRSPSTYRHISSILFCHIVDKAELRGATPNFLSKFMITSVNPIWVPHHKPFAIERLTTPTFHTASANTFYLL